MKQAVARPRAPASSGARNTCRNGIKRVGVLAVYHDASEILTGDAPTPIVHDRTLRDAYKKVKHSGRAPSRHAAEARGMRESAFSSIGGGGKARQGGPSKLSALRSKSPRRATAEFLSAEEQSAPRHSGGSSRKADWLWSTASAR